MFHFCGKYKCLSAYNGKEGLDVLQKHQVNLLIVDQMMPVMNGMDFVRTIKHNALTENVPVIMLTAKDDFDTEMQSIKAGVDVFIPKPFDFNKLLLQVARLIKRTQTIQRSNHIGKMIGTIAADERNAESADEVFMKELLKSIEDNMDKERYNVSMVSEMMNYYRYLNYCYLVKVLFFLFCKILFFSVKLFFSLFKLSISSFNF